MGAPQPSPCKRDAPRRARLSSTFCRLTVVTKSSASLERDRTTRCISPQSAAAARISVRSAMCRSSRALRKAGEESRLRVAGRAYGDLAAQIAGEMSPEACCLARVNGEMVDRGLSPRRCLVSTIDARACSGLSSAERRSSHLISSEGLSAVYRASFPFPPVGAREHEHVGRVRRAQRPERTLAGAAVTFLDTLAEQAGADRVYLCISCILKSQLARIIDHCFPARVATSTWLCTDANLVLDSHSLSSRLSAATGSRHSVLLAT